jgi:hypothetical protein
LTTPGSWFVGLEVGLVFGLEFKFVFGFLLGFVFELDLDPVVSLRMLLPTISITSSF